MKDNYENEEIQSFRQELKAAYRRNPVLEWKTKSNDDLYYALEAYTFRYVELFIIGLLAWCKSNQIRNFKGSWSLYNTVCSTWCGWSASKAQLKMF